MAGSDVLSTVPAKQDFRSDAAGLPLLAPLRHADRLIESQVRLGTTVLPTPPSAIPLKFGSRD
jgi:hypothetical protein